MCGICELGKNLNKANSKNDNEWIELNRNQDIYNMHRIVVENQREQCDQLIRHLNYDSWVLLLF